MLVVGCNQYARFFRYLSFLRLMFWTDWSFHSPKIERASLAGLDRIVLVDLQNSSQYWPNGIFIDYTEDRVYWIDAWIDAIDSCDLNGNNRRQVASPVHPIFNMHPFDFTVYDDILYWSDWNTDSIERLNWTTAAYIGGLGVLTYDRVFGVALLDNSRQPASAGKQIKIKQTVSWISITRLVYSAQVLNIPALFDSIYPETIQPPFIAIMTSVTEADVDGKSKLCFADTLNCPRCKINLVIINEKHSLDLLIILEKSSKKRNCYTSIKRYIGSSL